MQGEIDFDGKVGPIATDTNQVQVSYLCQRVEWNPIVQELKERHGAMLTVKVLEEGLRTDPLDKIVPNHMVGVTMKGLEMTAILHQDDIEDIDGLGEKVIDRLLLCFNEWRNELLELKRQHEDGANPSRLKAAADHTHR